MPTDPAVIAAQTTAAKFISESDGDFPELAGMFASHAAAAVAEREAVIVAWLFDQADDYGDKRWDAIRLMAERLQRRDHLKDQTHG